jgi:uncharacterized protein
MRVDKAVGHPYNWGVVLEEVTVGTVSTNIDVGGVLHAGRELDVRESVSLPDFGSYHFSDPADVSLRIRRVGRGVELRGSIQVEASGECARCLENVQIPVYIDVDESFEPGGEREDPLGESNVLTGSELDLADLVRQLVDSALPYVLLCDSECRGLCTTCGFKLDGACRCPHPE